LKTKYHPST